MPDHRFIPLSNCFAVLDQDGIIVGVSEDWQKTAQTYGFGAVTCGLGRPYLSVCTSPEAGPVAAKVRDLVSGRIDRFAEIYDCGLPGQFMPIACVGARLVGSNPGQFVLRHIPLGNPLALSPEALGERTFQSLKLAFGTGRVIHELPFKKLDPGVQIVLGQLLDALDNLRSAYDLASVEVANSNVPNSIVALMLSTGSAIDDLRRWAGVHISNSDG